MIYILYQNKFGGTDLLLKRLEAWLKKNGHDVASADSVIEFGTDIELVITPTSEMHRLSQLQKQGLRLRKVLVWCMGHGALKAAFYNRNFEKLLFGIPRTVMDFFIGRFAKSLLKTNSIIFTDEVGLQYDLAGVNLSNRNINDLLLPIAIKNYTPTSHPIGSGELTFGWVGRISRDFKILPLLKLMEDLESIAIKRGEKLKLIVVGDGDGATSFEDAIKEEQSLYIEWIRKIENDQILPFIDKNIDILFAMGTSALDGANTATPTVIIQPFSLESERPAMGYRWIFESKGFSLGEFPNTNTQPAQTDSGIDSIFSDIEKHGLITLAEQSKQYATIFYEDNVFTKMLAQQKKMNNQNHALIFFRILGWFYNSKALLKKIISMFKSHGAQG